MFAPIDEIEVLNVLTESGISILTGWALVLLHGNLTVRGYLPRFVRNSRDAAGGRGSLTVLAEATLL